MTNDIRAINLTVYHTVVKVAYAADGVTAAIKAARNAYDTACYATHNVHNSIYNAKIKAANTDYLVAVMATATAFRDIVDAAIKATNNAYEIAVKANE